MDTKKKTTIRFISVGVAGMIVGVTIGFAPSVFADPDNGNSAVAPANAPGQQKPNYNKNANGQTFGSELDAPDPADMPDLIAAIATNGEQGYVYATDLHPEMFNSPTSPEQAIQENDQSKTHVVTVYAEDGTTKIGVYVIYKTNG